MESSFPRELLDKSADTRKQYFRDCLIEHRNIKLAADAILRAVRQRTDASIILLFGPPGVGKTTLLLYVLDTLIQEEQNLIEQDSGYLPYIWMEAPSTDTGTYDWKDHYMRALIAAGEVLVDRKIDLDYWEAAATAHVKSQKLARSNRSALRRSLENVFRYRKVKALLIDEGHHITQVRAGSRIKAQMDTVKSLASLSRALHILFGTYDLLELRNQSGQLGRRTIDVHMSRYLFSDKSDFRIFMEAFATLLAHMPLRRIPDLIKPEYVEFIYERTQGCVGNLKSWLQRGLETSLSINCETLTYENFRATAMPVSTCRGIAMEIKAGEEKLQEDEDDTALATLHESLGMNNNLVAQHTKPLGKPDLGQTSRSARDKTKSSDTEPSRRKQIEPKPKRYKTGTD